MGKKAKAKPMRIYAVMCGRFPLDAFKEKRNAERCRSEVLDKAAYSIVEFVAVTPRKRQKGKSK